MKRLLQWAVRLYPRRWRSRYGAEFRALLEEVPPTWTDLFNILGEVCKIRLQIEPAWKIGAFFAALGATMALGIALSIPATYVSTSTVGVESAGVGGSASIHMAASVAINDVAMRTLNRDYLLALIQRENLYRDDWGKRTNYQLVERMKHSIRISGVSRLQRGTGGFRVSFACDRPDAAQRVVNDLTTALLAKGAPFPMSVLEAGSLPVGPVSPNVRAIVLFGGVCGLVAGLLVALIRTRIWPDPPKLPAPVR